MPTKTLSIPLLVGALVAGWMIYTARHASSEAIAADNVPVVNELLLPSEVATALGDNCLSCHGPDKQKGGIRLDTLDPDFVNGIHAEDWHDVLNAIQLGDMPPKGQPALADKQRRAMVGWITKELKRAKEAKANASGQTVLRRLTRYEYNNTMADLLGIKWDYAENLPPDSKSEDGFENNGVAQGI